MLERYVDGLKRSASRAEDFLKAEENKRPKLFVEFIEGIKVAAGSAHQLAHAQENPSWLSIRDLLEKIIDMGKTLPTFKVQDASSWMSIQLSLKTLVEKGKRIATSKSVARQDVLAALNLRELKARSDNDKLN